MGTTTLNHLYIASSCREHKKNKLLSACIVCPQSGNYNDTDIRLLDIVPQLTDALVFFFRLFPPTVSFCTVSIAMYSI